MSILETGDQGSRDPRSHESYNDYDGFPIQSSYYWLTTRLRGEFGFRGYVVSDSDAVEYLSLTRNCRRYERIRATKRIGGIEHTLYIPLTGFIRPATSRTDRGRSYSNVHH